MTTYGTPYSALRSASTASTRGTPCVREGRVGRADDHHAVACQVGHEGTEAGLDGPRRLVVVVEAALDDDEGGPDGQRARGPVVEGDAAAAAGPGAETGPGEAADVHLAGQLARPRQPQVLLAEADGPRVADHQRPGPLAGDEGAALLRVEPVLLATGRPRTGAVGDVERQEGGHQQHDGRGADDPLEVPPVEHAHSLRQPHRIPQPMPTIPTGEPGGNAAARPVCPT